MGQNPKELLEELKNSLPPVFGELAIEELVPGLYNNRTLKNLRSQGKGPRCFKVGRRVMYRRSDFLAWLESRLEQPGKKA